MKKIDEVRIYLERGYRLTIGKDRFKEHYSGALILQDSPYSIRAIYEVEIDSVMKRFPGIMEELGKFGRSLSVVYDFNNWSVQSMIQQQNYHGAYCEEITYDVVEDYIGEDVDVVSSFFALEDMIQEHQISFRKEMSR